jgi:hypothetical protein
MSQTIPGKGQASIIYSGDAFINYYSPTNSFANIVEFFFLCVGMD